MRKILNITKALADENRVSALMMLQNGEMCVCEIIDMLHLAPSTVSKHMSILRQAELVDTRREGKWTYYRLADSDSDSAVAEILHWLVLHLSNDKAVQRDRERLSSLCSSQKLSCSKEK